MASHYLPELLGVEPYEVWELSAFLVAGVPAAAAKRRAAGRLPRLVPHAPRAGISAEPRRLLGASGAEVVPFARPDLCCGFGGTFSVRQPEVSVAMADDKLAGGAAVRAIVTADPGCLMHLRGRAERVGSPVQVVHLATALARGAVTELAQPAERFREIARGKLGDAHMQGALDQATNRLRTHRVAAWAELPDVEALRERAHGIRMAVIDDLDGHVARFTAAFEARGGKVFFARTAEEASAYVAEVCRARARSWRRSRSRWRPRRSA